jgi:curved DNA-binding protein CbpA
MMTTTTTISTTAFDPYEILGLPAESDDEAIRRRYLELVRQFSPEHHPEKFAAIRAAYEQLRDLDTRVRHRLFEAGKNESIDALIKEITCQSTRRRVSLETLLATVKKS